MQPDPTRAVVDAILAATAAAMFEADADGDDERLFEWHNCPGCENGQCCSCSGVPYPSKAVRAGLAAALRWLADHAINPSEPDDPWWTAGYLRELADQLDTQAIVDPTDRACPDRPRCIPVGTCTRQHCDRCGGHNLIRDKPGDFAVCQACRDEMDAEEGHDGDH